jgi:hypothetical protein
MVWMTSAGIGSLLFLVKVINLLLTKALAQKGAPMTQRRAWETNVLV